METNINKNKYSTSISNDINPSMTTPARRLQFQSFDNIPDQ